MFLPILHDIPLFGSSMAKNWLWTLNLSPGVFGQGMITGPVISLHMLAGTVVGWGILSPIVKHNGWVSGEVGDWTMGSRGWILWIALSSLIVDCLVNLLWMAANLESVRGVFTSSWTWTRSILGRYKTSAQILQPYRIDEYDAQTAHGRTPSVDSAVTEVPDVRLRDSQTPRSERILPDTTPSIRTLGLGLIGASVLCIATTTFVFNNVVPIATIPLAIVFTSLLSVMSIRAYGQTDYTPVDGLGNTAFSPVNRPILK